MKLPKAGSSRGKITAPKMSGGKMAHMPKIKAMTNLFGLAPKVRMKIK